jgi:type III pantothenate kinase
MTNKLILDFGNTLKKLAVFQGDKQLEFLSTQTDVIQIIEDLRRKYPEMKSAILSSVIKIDIHLMAYLKSNFKFVFFNHEIAIPLVNKYRTP